jgi:branched-chain amino acid transport system substrate-binding protein
MLKFQKMNIPKILLSCLILSLFILSENITAQEKKNNYGNTPDEMVPYGQFQKAYKNFFDDVQEFKGAGREKPEPENLKSVKIGFLGPLEGSVLTPKGLQMLQGAKLAIEEANKNGGYKNIPFQLMEHNDVGLWGAAANEIVKMDEEEVWAFLGTIDDINSHVALRIALKLELMMVNTGDPDPTLTETRIPWLIRTISDDRQSSYALVNRIFVEDKLSRVAVIRANNRYGRVGIMEFSGAAQRIGYPIVLEVRYELGETEFGTQLTRIKNTKPDAIVIWGDTKESGLIVNQIKAMGMNQPIFGSDRMVSPEFIEITGKNSDGIVTTCQYNPEADNPSLESFKRNYIKRFNQNPDVFAAHAYDGMNILIEAINKAGLNRVLIRDILTDLKTFQGYSGITGEINLDASWNDIGDIWMAKVENGKFVFSLVSRE